MVEVEHITAFSYRSFINSPLVMIHFWASWDCRHLEVRAEIQTALERFETPIRWAMWDTDDRDSWPLIKKIGICNVPTIFYYKEGELASKPVGFRKAAQIRQILDQLVNA